MQTETNIEVLWNKRWWARSWKADRKEKKETHLLEENDFGGPDSDLIKWPEYIIDGNLRYVETYTNLFMGFAKAWSIGKTILKHCTDEFLAYPEGYHEKSI